MTQEEDELRWYVLHDHGDGRHGHSVDHEHHVSAVGRPGVELADHAGVETLTRGAAFQHYVDASCVR